MGKDVYLIVQAFCLSLDYLSVHQSYDALHLLVLVKLAKPREIRQQGIHHRFLSKSLRRKSVCPTVLKR